MSRDVFHEIYLQAGKRLKACTSRLKPIQDKNVLVRIPPAKSWWQTGKSLATEFTPSGLEELFNPQVCRQCGLSYLARLVVAPPR